MNYPVDHDKIEFITTGWNMFFENRYPKICKNPTKCVLKNEKC